MSDLLSAQYDHGGRIVRLGSRVLDHCSPSFDPLGAIRFGHRRLHYADRLTAADPTSRLSGAITDGGEGVGISFPLNGSWNSSDWAGAAPNIIWSLDDIFGAPLGGAIAAPVVLTVFARATIPAPADEWYVGVCIVNDTVLTGGTVDGAGVGIGGNAAGAAGPRAVRFACPNGVGTIALSTGDATAVGARGNLSITSIGSAGGISQFLVSSLDASGAGLQTTSNAGTANFGNPARLYLAAVAGRTDAAVAGGITIKADFYVSPVLRFPLLTATP